MPSQSPAIHGRGLCTWKAPYAHLNPCAGGFCGQDGQHATMCAHETQDTLGNLRSDKAYPVI
eukprot:1090-Eustigmatos_ZCMA.PRE.1